MPWQTPTLTETRKLVRDQVAANLPGADAAVPNSVLRVMADSNAGLAHLTLLYLDFLARQLMPDTAETEWLDRFGKIWVNGRKAATFATGSVTFTGLAGTIIANGTVLQSPGGTQYQTTEQITLGVSATAADVTALDPGSAGNQVDGASLSLVAAIANVDPSGIVVSMTGGFAIETDDSLRDRILQRIRKPPHGGAVHDYVGWAREVAGVTRAWARMESGLGTVTVRFMMDADRPPYGLPNGGDVAAVLAYLDQRRPVSVKDLFVLPPIPYFQSIAIRRLSRNTVAVRASLEANLSKVYLRKAGPGQTMYRSWIGEAVSNAAGEDHHELIYQTMEMPSPGHLPILRSVIYR